MSIKNVTIKDPASAITHFIGACVATLTALPLLHKAFAQPDALRIAALSVFAFSMIALYTASTVYHTFNLTPKINKILKKIDHMCIFVLIAGTYTPICLIVLHGRTGYYLLAFIWGIALLGMAFKAFWVTCPRWLSSTIYIIMGWTCVLTFSQIITNLSMAGFLWLLIGGIIYTIGGVIYALKLPIFNSKHKNFDSHAIFHLFVMGGSLCHFILMYSFVSVMPI